MITKPRFLIVSNIPYLVSVTYNKGKVTSVAGPFVCKGVDGSTVEEVVKGLTELLVEALHSSKPLELIDLPKDIRDVVEAQLSSSQSES